MVGECDGMGLVTAVEEVVGGDIPKLDTAMDVVVVVVVEVVEVDAAESASALLRAWKLAARGENLNLRECKMVEKSTGLAANLIVAIQASDQIKEF